MPSRFYYDAVNNNTFLNTVYASDLAIEQHFADTFFHGDKSRIVYSTNDFCFRKRVGKSEKNYSNADLPFFNYWQQDVNIEPDRFYWNHIANIQGIYSEDLGRKLRVVPIQIRYEASLWTHSMFDSQYARSLFFLDDSNETILYPTVNTTDGKEIILSAFLSYDFSDNEYEESDWLERNTIYNWGINPSLDVIMVYDDQGPVSLTEEIIVNFLSAKNELNKSDILNSDPYVLLTQYFSGS